MSKSKKNVIDPQTVINLYGADAVRWFVLSIAHQKEIFNGATKEFQVPISSYKKFGQFLK